MPKTVYRTATSLDGYIADSDNSLIRLFAVEQGEDECFDALVERSTTYEWALHEIDALAHPERWQSQ